MILFPINRMNQTGLDVMEFYISTNPGEPLKPLSKIASGGEMSTNYACFKKYIFKTSRCYIDYF